MSTIQGTYDYYLSENIRVPFREYTSTFIREVMSTIQGTCEYRIQTIISINRRSLCRIHKNICLSRLQKFVYRGEESIIIVIEIRIHIMRKQKFTCKYVYKILMTNSHFVK